MHFLDVLHKLVDGAHNFSDADRGAAHDAVTDLGHKLADTVTEGATEGETAAPA